jgi:hypothetical protein
VETGQRGRIEGQESPFNAPVRLVKRARVTAVKSGKGYQTTINAVLRKYVESRKGRTGQARKTTEGE